MKDYDSSIIGDGALGLKFKIGKLRFRIWKYGFEWDNGKIGKVRFFPWARFLK